MELRRRILHNSSILAIRQTFGLGIGVVGSVLMARLIGADGYGVYVAAAGLTIFFANLGKLGTSYYLIAQTEEPSRRLYDYAFTFMLIVGVLVTALLLASTPALGLWYGDSQFLGPLFVTIPATLFVITAEPARAILERKLSYREIANVEMAGEITYLALSVSLALLGFGFWGPAIGFLVGRSGAAMWMIKLSGYRPRLGFSPAVYKELLRYGSKISLSQTVGSINTIVIPLIIGRYAGPSGVAYINIANKAVDLCLFANTVAGRISFVTFSRLQSEPSRLRLALTQAMKLEVLACGLPLVLASVLGMYPFLVLFGQDWRSAWELFPLLAVANLIWVAMAMPRSALTVLDRAVLVGATDALELAIVAVLSALLIPEFGLMGFAYACLIGASAHILIAWGMRRYVGVSAWSIVPWVAIFSCAMFADPGQSLWSTLFLAPLLLFVVVPSYRRQLRDYVGWARELIESRLPRRRRASADALPS